VTNAVELRDACGLDADWLCEKVFDVTGNPDLAKVANWLVDKPVKVLIIVVLALIVRRLMHRGVNRFVDQLIQGREDDERVAIAQAQSMGAGMRQDSLALKLSALLEHTNRARQRSKTLGGLFKTSASAVVGTIALMMLLGEFDINVGPLIAGAGILGVAIGFGAQSLVRDLISGIFMLIEDQYGVGDWIDAGDAEGTVESVGLRTTRLRDGRGTLWYIPNGEIRRVGNMSQVWAKTILDIDVAYDTNLDLAMETIKRVADQLWEEQLEEATVTDEPVVSGVQNLGADAVTIRLVVRTEPSEQWSTGRVLRKRIKEAFDEAGIQIPFPQRTVWLRGEPETRDSAGG